MFKLSYGPVKKNNGCIAVFFHEKKVLKNFLTRDELISYEQINKDDNIFWITRSDIILFFICMAQKNNLHEMLEANRRKGHDLFLLLKKWNQKNLQIIDESHDPSFLAFVEGLFLSNYAFDHYKSKKDFCITHIHIQCTHEKGKLEELYKICESVYQTRDLVNEPPAVLSAVELSERAFKLCRKEGIKVDIFNKQKIQSLKMGGLLAVNRGSIHPPTFTILEWKPKKTKNKKPIVLVGKGIVYDTGGLNIKVGDGMTTMKCDMAGGAAVIGAILALARNKLPIHVVGLIPATDNRPGENAYAAGDIITMHNGKTVEVLNTDAEGRLILADALSYAKKYKPMLVIDLATLTGAAVRALGDYVIAAMGNASAQFFSSLEQSAFKVYERIAIQPFWDDYGELIKSSVADIKNIGGPLAGHITAGKFLEHFVSYPWIHLDIAGPAFMEKPYYYWGQGGTGVGVRLLYDFLKSLPYEYEKH